MSDSLTRMVRYFISKRGVSFETARRDMSRMRLGRVQIDDGLDWLQTVSGCREPEELRRSMVSPRRDASCVPYSEELNLSAEAYAFLVSLRELGIMGEGRFREVLQHVFRLPEMVELEELQEALLNDAYDRMVNEGEALVIEEKGQWRNKN